MDIKSDEISELVLPEVKDARGSLVYFKIIFIPAFLYILILSGYFNVIDFKVELHTVIMTGVIFFYSIDFC